MGDRKGRVLIIGRVDIILSCIFIILSAVGLRLAGVIGSQIAQFLNCSSSKAESDFRFLITLFFITKAINLAASILLVLGTVKEKIKYIAPWVGFNISFLIMASMITLLQWSKVLDSTVPLFKAFGIILISIALLVIRVYLCYEVYSLVREMRQSMEVLHTLIATAPEVREVRVNAVFVHVEEQSETERK